jgi:hypothetical protein
MDIKDVGHCEKEDRTENRPVVDVTLKLTYFQRGAITPYSIGLQSEGPRQYQLLLLPCTASLSHFICPALTSYIYPKIVSFPMWLL